MEDKVLKNVVATEPAAGRKEERADKDAGENANRAQAGGKSSSIHPLASSSPMVKSAKVKQPTTEEDKILGQMTAWLCRGCGY